MALSREAYQALEDIVGPENISEDPAILDSYAFQQHGAELSQEYVETGNPFMRRAEAVLLPGSTEEVQAIVRACNRYRIKCKARSTGWQAAAACLLDGVIMLDMRRMNRILEIDEKNMFAVCEPYVTAATLQAEAMKVGLDCNIIGAGAACSVVPTSLCLMGHGNKSIYMGHGNEVLLAFEWVLPNGDILRTGSLGSGNGWFCGEGPGPSLRGIARGRVGAAGGNGVFTKVAVRLSAWPGPTELRVEGIPPAYCSPLPENFSAYTLAFPSYQDYAEAVYRFQDSEIGYAIDEQFGAMGHDLFPGFFLMYQDPTKTLDDLEEFLKRPEIQKLTEETRFSFQVVLAGNSLRDFKYQEKVLDKILADTDGWRVAAYATPAMQAFQLNFLVRLPSKNLNFVYGGRYAPTMSQLGTPDSLMKQIPLQMEIVKKYQEKGLIVKSGEDSLMGKLAGAGGGGYCELEQFSHFDSYDRESRKAARNVLEDQYKVFREKGWRMSFESFTTAQREYKGKKLKDYYALLPQLGIYHWQWKIKQMIDPNDTSDSGYHKLRKLPK